MKTLIFIVLAVCSHATQFVFSNPTTERATVWLDGGSPFTELRLPPNSLQTIELRSQWDTITLEEAPSPFSLSNVGFADTVVFQVITIPDSYAVTVIPGWSWWDVAEKVFWAFCAYYSAKLMLRAAQSIWNVREP